MIPCAGSKSSTTAFKQLTNLQHSAYCKTFIYAMQVQDIYIWERWKLFSSLCSQNYYTLEASKHI